MSAALGCAWPGDRIGGTDERGDLVVGDTVLLLMNAHHEAIPFMLPPLKKGQRWERVLDTAREPLPFEGEPPYELQGRTMAVLHTTLQHKQAWQALGTAPSNSTGEPHAERRDHAYRAPL
jgi:glycogen operon protein